MKLEITVYEEKEDGILYRFELVNGGSVNTAFLFCKSAKTGSELVELSHGRFKRFDMIDLSLQEYRERIQLTIK